MKKGLLFGVIFGLIFGIFLIGVVSAGNCNDNDRIMKLYNATNSYGALWNDVNYNWDICYSDIFEEEGSGVRSCSGVNTILWLNDVTNAHAENPQTTYSNPVCYGNLNCRIIDEANAEYCAADEKMVLSLFSDTNSYITDPYYIPSEAVSIWKFDDDVLDSVRGNDGIMQGNPVYVDGKIGKALDFDGIEDYIEIGDPFDESLDFGMGSFSVGAWFKTSSSAVNSRIIDKYTGEIGDRAGYLISTKNGKIGGCAHDITGWATHICLNYDSNVNDGFWHYVFFVINRGNEKAFLYLDGELINSSDTIFTDTITNNRPFYIGISDGLTDHFDGLIDEVAVFNKALTPEEIQDLYNQGAYEKKICCKPETGDFYWAKMDNTLTATADIGDTVKLVVAMESAGAITYTLKECEAVCQITGGTIKWFDREVEVQTSSIGYMTWQTDKQGLYYFIATVDGTDYHSIGYLNGELSVLDIKNNAVPSTSIINPVKDTAYTITDGVSTGAIDFEQISSDPDDDLKITWIFGDGSDSDWLLNCLTSGNCNTTHAYNDSGTKTITLTAKEMETTRAQEVKSYSRVFVYKSGYNIFAIIDKPDFAGVVDAGLYDIDGSSSHVAYCENTCSSPCSSCYNVAGELGGTFECCNVADSSALTLEWTFDGTVSDKTDVSFQKLFAELKEHTIKLKASWDTILDESSTSLNVGGGGIVCSYDGSEWVDYRTFPWSSSPSIGDWQCYNSDPVVIDSRFCCPEYYKCAYQGEPGHYMCEYDDKDFCWKLPEEECNDYTAWVAINNIETALDEEPGYCGVQEDYWWDGEGTYEGEICWNVVECACEWDETSNNCTAVDNLWIDCNASERQGPPPAGECVYTLLTWEDTCDTDGFIRASWDAIGTGEYGPGEVEEDLCQPTGIRKIPCESMVKLAFFTLVNVIIAVLLIAIIYYLIKKKF